MSKLGKTLGITAALAGITAGITAGVTAGVTAGIVAVIKKVKSEENAEVHKCECGEDGKNKEHEITKRLFKAIFCSEGGNCDDSTLEEETTDTVDAGVVECLSGKEDCETCDFKDDCKLK